MLKALLKAAVPLIAVSAMLLTTSAAAAASTDRGADSALATAVAGSGQATALAPDLARNSPPVAVTVSRNTAVPCAPGGPYREGDDAVWHNCDASVDRIMVRQYFPYSNYEVCVAGFSDHRNSWAWTIDMYLIHDGRC